MVLTLFLLKKIKVKLKFLYFYVHIKDSFSYLKNITCKNMSFLMKNVVDFVTHLVLMTSQEFNPFILC